ncbi:cation diffusion facilitator family transporter [Flavisphingomonas formosensis]|uniref:cation diffusion facilitator family transporter n=1 Tax=Flavisphingomonas formosensis TaxID=861534 RepID=UPI001E42DA44|nr:cation diffusion facilitator family transporter [Sphingomonas formosensis]
MADHHPHDHAHHGHDHGHGGHGHNHAAGASERMLTLSLILTATYLVAEVIGAFLFNSLALLSDAGHMLTDVAALVIALMAIRIGQRAPDDRRTFGYRRLEILAAAFNAVMLFVVALYVLIEAIGRFRTPEPVQSGGMLAIATVGLVVNLVAMRLLMAGKDASLNVKGAYLEVWADMLGSIGVIAGALAIRFTGWTWIDPIVAIGIGLWVLPRTWMLLKDTTNVLLEGVPGALSLTDVRTAIGDVPGVSGVHDLHIWSMSTNDVSLTAHVEIEDPAGSDAVRSAVQTMLDDRFGITHCTIQTEAEPCQADPHPHP